MSLAISLSDTSLPSCFSDVPVPFFTSVCVCKGGGWGGGWRERVRERMGEGEGGMERAEDRKRESK
jgi:hypothetical protein